MKNNFTLLIFLFSFSLCSGQSLIDTNNEWVVSSCCYNFATGETSCSTSLYHFENTIAEFFGLKYQKLSIMGSTGLFNVPEYYREDSSRVYAIGYISGNGFPYLAYDFNLTPGQTVVVGEYNLELIVNAVDSVTLANGEKRKRLELSQVFSPSPTTYWIEGIGGMDAPLDIEHTFTADCWSNLSCFKHNNQPLYSNGSCTSTTADFPVPEPAVSLYPNPASDQVIIKGMMPEDIRSVRISDQLGRQWITVSNPASTVISLTALPKGLYVAGIEGANGRKFNRRFLIL